MHNDLKEIINCFGICKTPDKYVLFQPGYGPSCSLTITKCVEIIDALNLAKNGSCEKCIKIREYGTKVLIENTNSHMRVSFEILGEILKEYTTRQDIDDLEKFLAHAVEELSKDNTIGDTRIITE